MIIGGDRDENGCGGNVNCHCPALQLPSFCKTVCFSKITYVDTINLFNKTKQKEEIHFMIHVGHTHATSATLTSPIARIEARQMSSFMDVAYHPGDDF